MEVAWGVTRPAQSTQLARENDRSVATAIAATWPRKAVGQAVGARNAIELLRSPVDDANLFFLRDALILVKLNVFTSTQATRTGVLRRKLITPLRRKNIPLPRFQ